MSARPPLLLRLRTRGRVAVGAGVRLGRGVVWDVAPGGSVVLGDGVAVGPHCRFHVGGGAEVRVGAGTRLGERCVITAHERVEVGDACTLGDEVVLLDFDHVTADREVPVRHQGLATAPVVVGDRVRLDRAAVVLRGVRIGAGARAGVRALVTRDVAPGARVEGVPARAAGTPEPPVPATRRLVRR